jgi:hypothetical protein
MSNVLDNLKLRQAKVRDEFANRAACRCANPIIPGQFQGRSAGAYGVVKINEETIPVRMLSNGWISPNMINPIIISGGSGYLSGMPKGR